MADKNLDKVQDGMNRSRIAEQHQRGLPTPPQTFLKGQPVVASDITEVTIPRELFVPLSDFMIKRKPTGSITVNVRQGEAVGIEAIVKKQLATERIVPPHGHEELRKEDCFVVSGRETFAIPRRIFEVFVAFLGAPKLTGRFSIDFRQGNVTGLHISSQGVVTEEFSLIVDSRLTFEEFEALITEVSKYCKACGSLGIQIEF